MVGSGNGSDVSNVGKLQCIHPLHDFFALQNHCMLTQLGLGLRWAYFLKYHNTQRLTIVKLTKLPLVGFNYNTDFFTADYISIMESLVFNGSATSDRQCVNITILDDDLRETSIFNPQPEVFQVLLNVSEPNDAVQLEVQTASVLIEDDDCKYSVWNITSGSSVFKFIYITKTD